MKILIINDLNDYNKQIKQHFSLTKGYYFGKSLSNITNNDVFFLTTGDTYMDNNLIFINHNEITNDFMSDLNLLLLIRENNFIEIVDTYSVIKSWIFNDYRDKNQRLAIKSDSLAWVYSSSYLKNFRLKYDLNWVEFVAKYFDILFVQTKEFKDFSIRIIRQRFGNNLATILHKKIFISPMGIPNKSPLNFNLNSPYTINHDYCLDNYYKLKKGNALHPLCYTLKNRAHSNKDVNEYDKSKIILIYMGRIKVDNGKILYMMRDIMLQLGSDYELHIFPGRFILPYVNVNVWSPKYMDNLQTLRDNIFGSCDNVIIHVPFDEETKTKWIQFADIGIDFSSSRPSNIKSYAGHAKVLEYCYYGLKVVCERNINNSHLILKANNGILLNGLASVENYVDAIKTITQHNINVEEVSRKTIEDNNWDLIVEKFNNFLQKLD